MIVIDNSIVLAWCLADEQDALAETAMQDVGEHGGAVPGIWWYEIRNALVVNERRGRLTSADTHATLADLRDVALYIDYNHDGDVVLELARRHELSVYDAAYLELAQRRGLALATLDRRLSRAAVTAGVAIHGQGNA